MDARDRLAHLTYRLGLRLPSHHSGHLHDPASSAQQAQPPPPTTALESIKAQLIALKSDPSATKDKVAAVAGELEKLKYALAESEGGFTAKERAQYEKKKAKEERALKFQEQAEKPKETKKKEGAVEAAPPPPPQTFSGAKKDVSGKLFDSYHPTNVEAVWDQWWEAKRFFSPDVATIDPNKEKFVMVIPPPNVTGSLHIGHALTCSIEDALTRWHRMLGHQTLWLPGTDHAGIATQSVVEKLLLKDWEKDNTKPRTKQDMGRERFMERVWQFKNDKGNTILSQIRRLGASVDHSRTVFTMDDQNNRAVVEAFVRLHEQGKIYRATRLVHWSYSLKTAISSIEVDDEEITAENQWRKVPGHAHGPYKFGVFHHFAYKVHAEDLKPGMPDEICVATTRLETMLGDVAVAVHPDDPKYKSLHGVRLIHPYHPNRANFTVVCDTFVDMNLGTGAVKITPAHDENDFQAANRLRIDPTTFISIFDEDGAISPESAGNVTELRGMMRYDARRWIESDLTAKGLFRGETPNIGQILPLCSRSGDVVEPRLIPQWWTNCEDMAARAVKAVETKELRIVPDFYENVWYQWLRNIQPWCISRQLWWGHRIPAWRQADQPASAHDVKWFVARNEKDAREQARAFLNLPSVDQVPALVQDEDVLDTWFSSGLFPFASFGWPDANSPDLKAFFPGHLLETGHDILFFWVARMVMMSLALTDQLPFTTVYLHAMVRDKDGRKMSKTLGNVVDPVHVMEGRTLQFLVDSLREGNLATSEVALAEKGMRDNFPKGLPECGADALRYGLLAYTIQGRDINLDVAQIHAKRTFCNKIWNVCRFCEGLVEKVFGADVGRFVANPLPAARTTRDKWILDRLAACVRECNRGMKEYLFAAVTTALSTFWYDELADIYVEIVKPIFRDEYAKNGSVDQERIDALDVLYKCLDTGLRLLHPIMPFISEELWQHLAGHPSTRAESITIAPYPVPEAFDGLYVNPEACKTMDLVNEVTRAFRNVITPVVQKQGGQAAKKAKVFLVVEDVTKFNEEMLVDIGTGCKVDARPVVVSTAAQQEGMVQIVRADVRLVVQVEGGAIDVEGEKAKLVKKQQALQAELKDLKRLLSNAAFLAKAQTSSDSKKALDQNTARVLEVEKSLESVEEEIQRLSAKAA